MELLQKKDNRIGIIISVVLHISILIFIFFSKGCMEIQNPPQFTLEEVIVIDFSDAGVEVLVILVLSQLRKLLLNLLKKK